jgi:CheY-like chemotaxis protein
MMAGRAPFSYSRYRGNGVAAAGKSLASSATGASSHGCQVLNVGVERGNFFSVSQDRPYIPTESSAETKRVLIADDNRDSTDSLAMLLTQEGYDVRTSYDGREAIKTAREFRPHVIVLDIRMPNVTGFEAARVLGREPSGTRPVLIAITGSPGESDKLRATMSGFDHYLGKPVAPADLLELIKRARTA